MANEVKILVRVQNSGKAGLEAFDKDVETLSKKSSETFSRNFSEGITKNLMQTLTTKLQTVGQQAQESARRAGDTIGNTMGERITTRITDKIRTITSRFRSDGGNGNDGSNGRKGSDGRERVHVDVDVDKQSFLQRITGLGKSAGEKFSDAFGDTFKTAFTSLFSSDVLSTIIKGGLAVVAGGGLASVIAAALTSAVLLALGGGAIGAGVIATFKNPRIITAATGLKAELMRIFADFGSNFLGPVENFLVGSGAGGSGGLLGVIKQIEPMIASLGQAFGPVADALGNGIIAFLQNALPAIMRATEAAAPIVKVLADELPGIGDAIGDFFDSITEGSPAATVFFKDFLNLIHEVIRFLGRLIAGFTKMYGIFRTGFLTLTVMAADWAGAFVEMARVALGWIPGLGPKFDHAAAVIKKFKDKANATLNQIHDVDVTIRIRQVWTQVGQAVGDFAKYIKNHAAGGITGAASGGMRSGLTWVGEHGPELLDAPPGSRVHSAGDSQRMASGGGGGGGVLTLDVNRVSEDTLMGVLVRALRLEIFNQAGGNVQQHLGRGPA